MDNLSLSIEMIDVFISPCYPRGIQLYKMQEEDTSSPKPEHMNQPYEYMNQPCGCYEYTQSPTEKDMCELSGKDLNKK